jgi:hypothetical protein
MKPDRGETEQTREIREAYSKGTPPRARRPQSYRIQSGDYRGRSTACRWCAAKLVFTQDPATLRWVPLDHARGVGITGGRWFDVPVHNCPRRASR